MTVVEIAAVLSAAGFGVIAVFQVALALGAPLGRASWGGAHDGRLPPNLRLSSAVAALVWLIGALVVLARVDLGPISMPEATAYMGTWLFAVLSAVGAVVNFASSSPYERFGWGPLAAVLALLTLFVALS